MFTMVTVYMIINTMTSPTHHTLFLHGRCLTMSLEPNPLWLLMTTILLFDYFFTHSVKMMCVQALKCLKNCSFQSGQMEGTSGFDRDYSNG